MSVKSAIAFAAVFAVAAAGSLHGESSSSSFAASSEGLGGGLCSYNSACTVGGVKGVCVSVSAGCCKGGTVTSGLCPGSSDMKCCTSPSCTTPQGTGVCRQSSTCNGTSVAGYCAGPADIKCCVGSNPNPNPNPAGVPTRDEVMACAQDWVNRKVPYCQCINDICCGSCPYCSTYRCDCSGYVAYCLRMTKGLNTNSLPKEAKEITKAELKKGDFINCAGKHVVFFGGWTDSSMTSYVVYQEPGCSGSTKHAYKSVTTYPNGNNACYKPYRRNGMSTLTAAAADSLSSSSSFDETMASPEDIKEAFLNAPYFADDHYTAEESEGEMKKVQSIGQKLGYFTFA